MILRGTVDNYFEFIEWLKKHSIKSKCGLYEPEDWEIKPNENPDNLRIADIDSTTKEYLIRHCNIEWVQLQCNNY